MIVRIDGDWYDLSNATEWRHPGGDEILRRQSGKDITHLFYLNHFGRFEEKKKRIEPFRLNAPPEGAELCPVPALNPCSALYLDLKHRESEHLQQHGIPWRHTFDGRSLALRLSCLLACACAPRGIWSGAAASAGVLIPTAIGSAIAAAFGILMGRATWTHAHNAVHNPARMHDAMRRLSHFDLAGLIDVWMAEHHAHHAFTNTDRDPDMSWFSPVLRYNAVAEQGGVGALVRAILIYPFLLPFMLVKSAIHAIAHDSQGPTAVAFVVAISPLRFGLDLLLLGPPNFGVAILAASAYVVATFVATHQTPATHRASSGDWMIDQLQATNNVAATNKFWSLFCGGINCHIEHHLFPMISNDALHRIAPVVQNFAEQHALPYHGYATWPQLVRSHVQLLTTRRSA